MIDPPLSQPTPRRDFDTFESSPPTPRRSDFSALEPDRDENQDSKRSHSVLNLTSSTLFGIYSPSGVESVREQPSTPFGNGAQTPGFLNTDLTALSKAPPQKVEIPKDHANDRQGGPPLILRLPLLFICGVAYGLIITHLHDDQQIAPVKVDHIDRNSWHYLMLWGSAGVVLGGLLPWVDIFWEEALGAKTEIKPESPIPGSEDDEGPVSGSGGPNWNQVVRGIGAFVGIAFAIRKLPWQSTLQVSLTLALVNPFLWYLVDRSKPGFFLSSFVGILGTAVLLGLSPEMMPTPPSPSPLVGGKSTISIDSILHERFISHESIGVWTWIASVLFCSSVCFGNIGRRLALGQRGKKAHLM